MEFLSLQILCQRHFGIRRGGYKTSADYLPGEILILFKVSQLNRVNFYLVKESLI